MRIIHTHWIILICDLNLTQIHGPTDLEEKRISDLRIHLKSQMDQLTNRQEKVQSLLRVTPLPGCCVDLIFEYHVYGFSECSFYPVIVFLSMRLIDKKVDI